jgi:hypothetical protein
MPPGLYEANLLSGASSNLWLNVTQANYLLCLTQSMIEIFSLEKGVFICGSCVKQASWERLPKVL